MWTAPIPADEQDRLADLRRLDILLTTPEEPLDHVTRELARIFDVPGAFISFIDEDTQYYKSEVGLPPPFNESRTEPREMSICSYVVGTNDSLVVEDLSADARFRDNPAVTQFGVRFYAGAPLRGDGGHAVGSLCIVDSRPRSITDREQQMLDMLAEGVMARVRLIAASRQLVRRSLEIERDLRQAVGVQRFLLPKPRVEGGAWQIAHVYRPIEHLGGDFLDVQRRADGSWVVLIADVCGHGTTAALMAAMIKTAFLRALAAGGSPAEVLSDMNRELSAVAPPGQFVTAQVVVLDQDAAHPTIASAGHPYPLLRRRAGAIVIDIDNGPPLLLSRQPGYRDTTLETIGDGEAILLYTDGATEARDRRGRYLGADGLCALVASAGAPQSPEKILDALLAYAGDELGDDVALLEIRRRPL